MELERDLRVFEEREEGLRKGRGTNLIRKCWG